MSSTKRPRAEDPDDAAVRSQQQHRSAVKVAVARMRQLARAHGVGSVALAPMGSRGIRLVLVAADGAFGDVIVSSPAAADEACATAEWPISGWDTSTVGRLAPSPADRRRMAGTGR